MWNVDGVTITDMAATGSSSVYFDFDSFQEISFTTGGADASIQTGGVNLNFITKSGGNTPRGSGPLLRLGQQLSIQQRHPRAARARRRLRQSAEEHQGLRRRSRRPDSAQQSVVLGRLRPPGHRRRRDQLSQAGRDRSEQSRQSRNGSDGAENYNVKLQLQPSQPHRFSFLYTFSDKIRNNRGAGPLNPPETTFRQSGSDADLQSRRINGCRPIVFSSTRPSATSMAASSSTSTKTRWPTCSASSTSRATPLSRSNQQSGTVRTAADRDQDRTRTTSPSNVSAEITFVEVRRRAIATRRSTARATSVGSRPRASTTGRRSRPTCTATTAPGRRCRRAAAYFNDSFTRGRCDGERRRARGLRKGTSAAGDYRANPIAPELLPALAFPGADTG